MKRYVMGLDIGTSSVKGVLLNAGNSTEVYTGRVPFRYMTAPDGTVEIPAEDYRSACCRLLSELSAQLPEDGELAAVCAASASGNTLLLGEDGEALTPVFNWQDTRAENEAAEVLGDFDREAYFRSTGWAFDGKTFPLAHLSWLKCRRPELLEKAAHVTMSTEYLYRYLTGFWGISTSAGTPFYLIDQVSGTYRTDMLARFGIAEGKLPPVVKSGTVIGKVTEEAAEKTGLPAGTPVVAGTFDHPSAARGVGVLKEGQLLLSCGTSWVGFYPVESREKLVSAHMLIDPFLSESGGPWAGMVSLASVAARIDEYVTKYIGGGPGRYPRFEAEAKKSSRGAGGLTLKMDGSDREDVIRSYPKCDIARAIMECVIGMLKKDFDRLEKMGIRAESAVMVGGPSECPYWTTVIEEMTGIPVEIRHGAFAGSRGAAIVAGIGAGLWKDPAEALGVIG